MKIFLSLLKRERSDAMHYDATTLCANIDDIQVKAFLLCVFEMVNTLPLKSQAENELKRIIEICNAQKNKLL